MSLRDRTKKRLRWLAIIVLALGVIGTSGYFLRRHQIEKATLADRQRGLEELSSGDYFQAMNDIGRYVQRHPNDAGTLYSYAQARQQVPEPDGRHIREAMSVYRQVLTLQPRNFLAADALLELYTQYHMSSEALALSNDVLAGEADNREALKAQAFALYALKGAPPSSSAHSGAATRQAMDQALHAALNYNAKWPADLEGQMLTLDILDHTDAGPQAMVAHVQNLLKQFPNDPHFQLLMGYVDLLPGGDRAEAKSWLEKASGGVLPDLASLQLLVRCCDGLGLFDHSFAAISRQAAQSKDPQARRLLAGRLWENERYAELVSQFPPDVTEDGQVAALRCLALEQLGRRDEAKSASSALSDGAAKNPIARPWASIVKAMVAGAKPDDAALITACEKALNEVENPYIRMIMGDAYMRIGDADTAMEAWQHVYREPPAISTLAWAAPRMRLANASLSVGHFDDAAGLAQQALDRMPGNAPATLLLANALAMKMERHDAASAGKVLALLDELDRTAAPPPDAGPLRVQVLAVAGRKSEALASAEKIFSASANPPAGELLQLASISRSLRLGIESRCADRCEQLHGMSPDLALWKVSMQIDSGQKPQAVSQFDAMRSQSGAQGTKQDWEVARARVLELVKDSGARSAWEALADAYPDDAQIQWQAIGAPSVQSDRSFIRKTLDRLREQYGADGLRWRLTQARWLLGSTNSQDLAEAALMLKDLINSAPQMVLPRMMLADSLVRLGNYSGAVDQLSDALTRQPQSAPIALKLAGLLQSHGDTVRARNYLDRVTANPTARLPEIRQAAEMLDAQGDAAGALSALSKAYGSAINAPPADLLLATLYRKTNQPDRAEKVLKRLLQKPDAGSLEFAADFYASIGRSADAEAALKQLDTVPTAPGEKELSRGVYAMRSGNMKQAQAMFTAATRLAPQNPQAWRQLIRVDLARHDDQAAQSAATAGLAALPNDAGLAAYCRNSAQAVKLQPEWPEFGPLLAELLVDPQEEQTFTSAADLVSKAVRKPATNPSAAAAVASNAPPPPLVLPRGPLNDLCTLAGNHVHNFAVQVLAARASLLAGDTESASEIAQRAVSMRSGDPLAMTFAANTLLAGRQWDDIAALLRPRLKLSAQDRIGWMRLAVMVLPDPAQSKRWLDEVEPLSLKGDVSERLALAQCWQDLEDRAHDAPDAAHAKELASAIASQLSTLSAGQALTLGCLQEQQGDLAQAEKSYRQSVTRDPKGGIALNNLAMLLARQHQRLDEALKLANDAVAAGGAGRANFYDTLSFVQGQRGDYAAAVAAAKEALALSPGDPQFQIRLATMLLENHDAGSAKMMLEKIQSRPEFKRFPPDLLKQIDSLHQRLDGTASAG